MAKMLEGEEFFRDWEENKDIESNESYENLYT